MTAAGHLADEQFAGYRNRTLSPAEVLEVDAHVAECAECRDRLYIENHVSAGIRTLRSRLARHLGYAEIVACSEGNGKPSQLQHLRECPGCQGDVQDLSRFRTERVEIPRKPQEAPTQKWMKYRLPVGIGAAVLAVAGLVAFVLTRPKSAPTPPAAAVQRADPALPAAEREILQRALTAGKFEPAPILSTLITAKPGAPAPTGLYVLGPLGTAVLIDRPVFRWSLTSEAVSFVVSVFDDQSRKLAESPTLTSTDWSPPAPLPRGVVLKWHVTARTTSGGTIQAPAAGEPEARFQVVPQSVVDRIEVLRRDFPGNPMLLAALYAHAGALDAAETTLQGLDSAASQTYREGIRNLRQPR
jgi:hypothetical protein